MENKMNPKKLFWIDEDYDILYNKGTKNSLESKPEYISLNSFKDLNSAFKALEKLSYEVVFILVRRKYYEDYYYRLKELRPTLNCIPKTMIFTRLDIKLILEGKEEEKKIKIIKDKEVLESIGDEYYNPGKICVVPTEVLQYIGNCIGVDLAQEMNTEIFHSEEIHDNNFENIIIEYLYSKVKTREYLINDLSEITNFCIKLKKDHPSKDLNGFNDEILESNQSIPFEKIIQFWIHYFTDDNTFNIFLNKDLQDNIFSNYNTFIKALNKGLVKKYLNSKFDSTLYYCCSMKQYELETLEKNSKNSKKELIYSRQFLSFSQDKNVSLKFIAKQKNDSTNLVLFELDASKSKELFASNIDIEKFSKNPKNKEVIFLPYTCFIIDGEIKEDTFEKRKYKKIKLNYLGNYENQIKKAINNINEMKIKDLIEKPKNEFIKDIKKKYENDNQNMDEYDLIKSLNVEAGLIKEKMKNKKDYKNEIKIKMIGEGKFLGDDFFNLYHWMLNIYFDNVLQEEPTNKISGMPPKSIKIEIKYPLFDCERMFYLCENISEIKFITFDTSKVTNMKEMFSGCFELKAINVNDFDTTNVNDMSCMFYQCSSLRNLDLSKFNTRNVTTMSAMFYFCESLENLNFDLAKMHTDKLEDVSFMLKLCISLKNYDVSKFDLGKIKYREGFF